MSEFKEFVMKESVIDLAIGIVIVGAFRKIVSFLVNDVNYAANRPADGKSELR